MDPTPNTLTENVRLPDERELTLIGCGILSKEIEYLIKKKHWPIKTKFLCSSLHMDFDKLHNALNRSLAQCDNGNIIVFYGTCHPLLDRNLKQAGIIRTEGQNCVEILLGKEIFSQELSGGAFFLMEDWARRWFKITKIVFGTHPDVRAAIFKDCHTSLLGIRTPCSEDFVKEAEEISKEINLPLRWMNVSLDHLEKNLKEAIQKKRTLNKA